LTDPIVLKVLARPLARLRAGRIRKKAVAAVAGFSEDVAFALEQHFLVKVAGIGARQTSTQSPLAAFVEAPSTRPLFFERRGPDGPSRYDRAGSARQHLANVLFAGAILQRHGLLTAANRETLAALCDEGFRDLSACDAAAFRRYARRLREIDPRLVPSPEVPRSYVQVLRSIGGWVSSRTGARYRATSQGTRLKQLLPRVRGRYRAYGIAAGGQGIAKPIAQGAGERVLPWSSKRVAPRGAMTAALLGGILALGAFAGLSGSLERSKPGGAPTIVVVSTIYAEPSSRWPMPIEVGPAQSVPPDSKLLLRGLPPGATLSARRPAWGSSLSPDWRILKYRCRRAPPVAWI
jgi:hypothetical protein